MTQKLLLSSILLGILSLNIFSQETEQGVETSGVPNYLTLPLTGELEYTPPISFFYTLSSKPDSMPGDNELSVPGNSYATNVLTLTMGSVGIKTISPKATFHVVGTGLVTKSLTVGTPSATLLDGVSGVKLQIGNAWAFTDLNFAKIMGYNYVTLEGETSQGRIMDGASSAVVFKNDGSLQLRTAPYGIKEKDPLAWNYFTMLNNGDIGIGTTNPLTKFQIGNMWTFYDGSNDKIIGRNTYYNGSNNVRITSGIASRIYFGGSGDIVFQTVASGSAGSTISTWNTVAINNDGSVGIGVMNTNGYKLCVNGKINCTEVVVTTSVSKDGDEWPDYVFSEDYALRSLDEVASYIQENKRLPEIPSAAEVSEKGINLLEINTLLLKKVEELTLYVLQQNEKMTDLQSQINDLKK